MLRVAAEEADRADALVGTAAALSHYQTNTDADEVRGADRLAPITELSVSMCGRRRGSPETWPADNL